MGNGPLLSLWNHFTGQRLVLKILVFTVTLPLNDEDDQQIDEDIIINDDEPLFPVDAVDDDDHVTCSTTVIVGDSSARKTHELALCVPGRSRVRHLYTSVGHQVSLYVANSDEVDDDDDVMQRHLAMGMTSSVRFMISYEGKICGRSIYEVDSNAIKMTFRQI